MPSVQASRESGNVRMFRVTQTSTSTTTTTITNAHASSQVQAQGRIHAYSVLSQKGIAPGRADKINQDRAVMRFALANDATLNLYGVMDGHGPNGHFVAAFIEEYLPKFLVKQRRMLKSSQTSDVERGIETAVDELNCEIGSMEFDCQFSGSTAVFAIHTGSKLIVANLGDSRAILCRLNSRRDGFDDIALSIDHKPDRDCECKRILELGGRIETLPGDPSEDNGPLRIWLQDRDIPGLALSRVAAGDLCARQIGVSTTPEFLVHDIGAGDVFVVFATDGVWEFLSNSDVAALMWEHRANIDGANREIVAQSTARWNQEEDEVVDDITCVVVQLHALPM